MTNTEKAYRADQLALAREGVKALRQRLSDSDSLTLDPALSVQVAALCAQFRRMADFEANRYINASRYGKMGGRGNGKKAMIAMKTFYKAKDISRASFIDGATNFNVEPWLDLICSMAPAIAERHCGIFMHSDVLNRLVAMSLCDGDAQQGFSFLGRPIVIDDSLAAGNGIYDTMALVARKDGQDCSMSDSYMSVDRERFLVCQFRTRER